MNITYLYNLFFGAWLTEVCVFFFFFIFQMLVFTFRKWGVNTDVEARIFFFPNEFLKIFERLQSGKQTFGLHCRSDNHTNVYNDLTSIKKRDGGGAGHSKFHVRSFWWLWYILKMQFPFFFNQTFRRSSGARTNTKEFINVIVGNFK